MTGWFEQHSEGRDHMSAIIDVHTHLMLKSWERAYDRAGLPRVEGRPVQHEQRLASWEPSQFLEIMDRNGIQTMVMSWPPGCDVARGTAARETARAMNEEYAAIVRGHPSRFGAFAALPLDDMDAAVAEVGYALDHLGLDGVCLPTNWQGQYFNDERFVPLFAEFDRRRALIFVHPVHPAYLERLALPYNMAIMEFMFDSTRMLTSLIYSGIRKRFPNFELISTHAGGTAPYLAARLAGAAGTLGVGNGRTMPPAEVLEGLRSFHFDLSAATSDTTLGSLLNLVPPTRLMFGSDTPIMPERAIPVAKADLSSTRLLDDNQRDDIFNRTALKLLPRLSKAIAGTAGNTQAEKRK
jgi:predicted TIM-barrel fold metal-dependent hydrolase